MADFDKPKLKEFPEIPHIHEGVMAHSKPFVAKEQFQEPPVLLLDDLASELDKRRQEGFFNFLLNKLLKSLIYSRSEY